MKPSLPTGTESARPFLPARDFELSKQFYEALGFEKRLDGEVAIFGVGAGGFVLQKRFAAEWAENCMMQLMVDDLDAWWAHVSALDLTARFGVPAPTAPELQPWGLRVAYLTDPSGVLWHIAQRRPHTRHDE
jgi:catechol 2,3-dioxygenase-like lactoylglutathione lyase family enzyme